MVEKLKSASYTLMQRVWHFRHHESVMDPHVPDSVRQRLRTHDVPKLHLDDRYIAPKG